MSDLVNFDVEGPEEEEEEEDLKDRYPDMAAEFGGKEEPDEEEEDGDDLFQDAVGLQQGLSEDQMDNFNRDRTVKQFSKNILVDYDLMAAEETEIPEQAAKVLRKAVELRIKNVGCVTQLPSMSGKEEYIQIRAFYLNHRAPQDLKERYSDMVESDTAEARRILRNYHIG